MTDTLQFDISVNYTWRQK